LIAYFMAKFTQASGIGWVILGLYVGLTRGSMKWEAMLMFMGIFIFLIGYFLEKVISKSSNI
jgi:hypothetical protein